MSGQNWSIMITASGFVVDAFGQSGSTLNAQNGDVISWNNQTDQVHQPYQTPTGPQLCDPIPAWKSSSPGFVPALEDAQGNPINGTITYNCKNHPSETGTINIVGEAS